MRGLFRGPDLTALGLATVLAVAAGPAAEAQTRLTLVEVITSPQRTELVQKLVDGYEAANPGVEVEIVSLPWGQAFEKLLTMVQGGDRPDVVEMPERWRALYVARDELEDLGPYLADWEHTEGLSERTKELAGMVEGETPYMLPYGFYIRAMFYNKDLFEQAGLDGPPETMADFMDAAAKVSELDGKYGYCLRGGKGGFNGWYMFMAAMNDKAEWFDEEGDSTFDEPGAIEGIRFMLDLYQKGYAPKDAVNWGFNEIVAGFYSGTCAMLDQDPDALIAVQEHMDEGDFAVAPMPVGPGGRAFPTLGFAGWSMFKSAEDKDAAWDLIAHLSSPESNLEWSKFVGVIPIYESAAEDPYFDTPQFSGWFTELNDPSYVLTPMPGHLEEFGYFFDVLSVQTAQEALLGEITAEELGQTWADYLTNAQKEWLAKQGQ